MNTDGLIQPYSYEVRIYNINVAAVFQTFTSGEDIEIAFIRDADLYPREWVRELAKAVAQRAEQLLPSFVGIQVIWN